MGKIVAVCGINCEVCPAYIATASDDDELRRKTAEQWSKQYNADIKPEHINCVGCLSKEGPVINHCNVCEIRRCGMEREVLNCAHCSEYACEKLNKFLEMVPDARKTLDEIRQGL